MNTTFNLRDAKSLTAVSSTARPALLGLLTLAGAGLGTPARAQQTQPVQVTQPDAESLRIRINNTSKRPATLQVMHLNTSNTILSEVHREPAYGTLLKFNNLPSGRYAVILRVGANRYRYHVQVDKKAPGLATITVRETTTRLVESGLATASL
jgi:hypothetical protein